MSTHPMTRPPNEDDDEERLQRSTNTTTKETEANNEEGAKGQTFRKRRLSLTLQKDSRPLKQAGTGVNNDEDDDDDDDHNEEGEADDTQSHTLHIHASEDHCSTTANSSNGLHAESNHSREDDEEEEEEDEKAHTFRKRRLSLTTTNQTTTTTCGPNHSSPGKFRRSSMDSHSSFASSVGSSHDDTSSHHHHHHTTTTSSSHAWISRTLHAGELIGTDGTLPPSPAHGPSFSTHFLYQTANHNTLPPLLQPPVPPVLELGTTAAATNPPSSSQNNRHHHNEDGEEDRAAAVRDHHHHTNNNNNNNNTTTTTRIPKWKRRHTFDARRDNPDHKLPFHLDVVGTYSCHGVEPVYSSLDNNDDEDDHDDGRNNNNNYHIPAMVPVTVAKINQDRGGVVCPYRNHPRTALFAVYDGHGHGGELVSQFALYEIQRRLEKHPLFDSDIERAMKETFLAVDDALTDEPSIDPMFAGTTACVVLLQNQRLTIANAGDSRAVCGRRKSPTTNHHSNHHHNEVLLLSSAVKTAALFPYVAIDLSHDQNPDVPAEMARIQAAGGYVSLPPGPGLSARVWLDPRCTQIGLAMSRSIGDHAISTVGVIAEPEVTYHDITEEDEFFIVASDGVWEFLDSTEAVNIVGNNLHRGSTKACQALIEAASARWYEEEGAYRDDITAIVVRLTELWKKVENGKLMR